MKKRYFPFVAIAILATTTMTLTSCGDDEDDLKPGTEQPDAQLGYKYVEPCLKWNASKSEVAAYMAKLPGWHITEANGPQSDMYMLDKPATTILNLYGIANGLTGLCDVTVMYYGYDLEDLRSNIEKAHNCVFQPKSDGVESYETEVRINDRRTKIGIIVLEDAAHKGQKFMNVKYTVLL